MDGRASTTDGAAQETEGLRTGNDEGPAGERPAVPARDVITRAVADDAPLPLGDGADHSDTDADPDADARADDDGLAPAFEAPEPA